jgi:hypothetical protein
VSALDMSPALRPVKALRPAEESAAALPSALRPARESDAALPSALRPDRESDAALPTALRPARASTTEQLQSEITGPKMQLEKLEKQSAWMCQALQALLERFEVDVGGLSDL